MAHLLSELQRYSEVVQASFQQGCTLAMVPYTKLWSDLCSGRNATYLFTTLLCKLLASMTGEDRVRALPELLRLLYNGDLSDSMPFVPDEPALGKGFFSSLFPPCIV
jgi:hypothetical protein